MNNCAAISYDVNKMMMLMMTPASF